MKTILLIISIFLLLSNISWASEDALDFNYRPNEDRKDYSFHSLGLSYTKFPIEEMKNFISLDVRAQLKRLNYLGIKIYKHSINEERGRVNRKIDVIKYLEEVPSYFTNPACGFDGGVYYSLRDLKNHPYLNRPEIRKLENDVILIGSLVSEWTYYHEVAHALIERQRLKDGHLGNIELSKKTQIIEEKFNNKKHNNFLSKLNSFDEKVTFRLNYTFDQELEESLVNYNLFDLLDLKKMNEQDIGYPLRLQLDYQLVTCTGVAQRFKVSLQETKDFLSKNRKNISSNQNYKVIVDRMKMKFASSFEYLESMCNRENLLYIKTDIPSDEIYKGAAGTQYNYLTISDRVKDLIERMINEEI